MHQPKPWWFYNIQHSEFLNFRQFWITWLYGKIAAGFGEIPGILEIINYEDPDPISISYYAISTGWGASGDWEINELPGMKFIINAN